MCRKQQGGVSLIVCCIHASVVRCYNSFFKPCKRSNDLNLRQGNRNSRAMTAAALEIITKFLHSSVILCFFVSSPALVFACAVFLMNTC